MAGKKRTVRGKKSKVAKKKPTAKKKSNTGAKKYTTRTKSAAAKRSAKSKTPAAARKKSRVTGKKAGKKKKISAAKRPAVKKAPAARKKKAVRSRKVIVVIGSTGAQGGGLARTILADSKSPFSVRAVTRNPKSDKARELARMGAEVVAADLDDVASLADAFKGAYGAYCVTNFWEHFSPDKEIVQAAHMADAAKTNGLKYVIWSTLEDSRKWIPLSDNRMPTLMGNYKVPHFDAKGAANRQFTDRKIPVTFLLTSFYWENLIYFGMGPQRGADGVLGITMAMGDRKLPGISAEDIGRCAYSILRDSKRYVGKTVGIAGEHVSGAEMAAAMSKSLGTSIRYNAVDPATYRGLGFPGADDLGNMFQFNHDFNDDFRAARDVEETRALNPSLQSFDTWLSRNKERIPVPD